MLMSAGERRIDENRRVESLHEYGAPAATPIGGI
jgi:hypothetical protein